MNILTWHGAVVRLDRRRNRLVQDPLWLTDTDGADFAFDATSSEPVKTPLGEIEIERGGRTGTIRLRHGHKILRALPSHRELTFEPEEEHDVWGSFLVLAPNDLADLRHILENRWPRAPQPARPGKSRYPGHRRLRPGTRRHLPGSRRQPAGSPPTPAAASHPAAAPSMCRRPPS